MKKIMELYKKHEEIVNYLIVGGLTTVVSLASYYICVLTVLNPKDALELQIANIISWICAVTFAYVTNRKFVFKSKSKDIKREVISFTSARIVTLIMDMVIMWLMVTLMHFNDKIAKLVVQVVVTIGNYLLSKLFVFKKN